MKQISLFSLALAGLLFTCSCKKATTPTPTQPGTTCNNPASATPTGLVGNWVSGYASLTQIVDVYNGSYVGNAWVSGKFFKFTSNGTGAEFYYSAQAQSAQTATKTLGNIYFDEGATATAGSFTFYPCWGHYKGWGSMVVDRDATAAELVNNLTRKYFYQKDGQWLRIEPNGPVNAFSSSFRLIN